MGNFGYGFLWGLGFWLATDLNVIIFLILLLGVMGISTAGKITKKGPLGPTG